MSGKYVLGNNQHSIAFIDTRVDFVYVEDSYVYVASYKRSHLEIDNNHGRSIKNPINQHKIPLLRPHLGRQRNFRNIQVEKKIALYMAYTFNVCMFRCTVTSNIQYLLCM